MASSTHFEQQSDWQSKQPSHWQRAIIACYHFLLLSVPLFFVFRTHELFEFNKMILVYAGAVLIAGLWSLRMLYERRLIIRTSSFDIPLLLFLLSQLASTLLSMHPRTSFLGYYGRFHGGLLSWLAYSILYYGFVSNVPVRAYPQLLISALGSSLVVSTWGILEKIGHSPSCFIVSSGQSFGVDCWVQKVQERVFATFGQPNWLAAYIVTLVPLGLAALIHPRWARLKAVASTQVGARAQYTAARLGLLALISAQTAVLLFTASRSGFLALTVGLSVFVLGALGALVLSNKQWRGNLGQANFDARWFVAGITSIALTIALFGSPYTPRLLAVFGGNPDTALETNQAAAPIAVDRLEAGGTDSGEIRKIVWGGALAVWQRYPLFGSGVETFAYSYYRDRPLAHNLVSEWDFLYNKAHNELLNFLATTGAVGLSAYLLLLIWPGILAFDAVLRGIKGAREVEDVRQAGRARRDTLIGHSLVLIAIIAGMAAQFVSNFFGFSTVTITMLLFLGFAAIVRLRAEILVLSGPKLPSAPATSASKNKQKTDALPQHIAAAVIIVITLSLLVKIATYWLADTSFSTAKAFIAAGNFQDGALHLERAIERSSGEALFYDELATLYSAAAVELYTSSAQPTTSTESAAATESGELAEPDTGQLAIQAAQLALQLSDATLALNPVHLNFHKSRVLILSTLAQIDPQFLDSAQLALANAIELAPNDPKLWYNAALLKKYAGDTTAATSLLEHTLKLKPDYLPAAEQLEQLKQLE